MDTRNSMDGRTGYTGGLHARQAVIGVGGALGGAALGSMAGPPGAIAGAVIGGVIGALAAAPWEDATHVRAAKEIKMDEDLGISGGDIGAPNLQHPPAKIGAFSAASSGAGSSSDAEPAEGPMPPSE